MNHFRSFRVKSSSFSRAIAGLLALVAVLTAVSPARAETWTFANSIGAAWSNGANWTEATGAGAAVGSPPGTAGNIYTNVRLGINGTANYTATEGTQTYDISAAEGENRSLVIATTDFNSAKGLTLSGAGANLVFIPESGVTPILVGAGVSVSYAGQASLIVNDGATLKVQTAGGAVTGDIDVLSRGLATASGTLTIGGTGTGSLVSADRVTFGALAVPTVSAGATGTLNINSGGTLLTREVVVVSANSNNTKYVTINFNGGTLKSADTNNSEIWISDSRLNLNLLAGGGTFDTNGQNGQTISAVIAGTAGGSLTKTGLGTLILSAANSYNGTTNIENGTVALGAAGTISSNLVLGVSAGTSGTLDVTAKGAAYSQADISGNGSIISAGTVTATGTVAPGFSIGTIAVTGGFTLGATTLMELASNTNAPGVSNDYLNVSGALAYDGALTISAFGGYDLTQAATYDLFDLAAPAGGFNSVTITGAGPGALTEIGTTGVWTETGTLAGNYTFSEPTGILSVVPEPSTFAMILGGFGTLLGFQRARRRVQA